MMRIVWLIGSSLIWLRKAGSWLSLKDAGQVVLGFVPGGGMFLPERFNARAGFEIGRRRLAARFGKRP